MISKAILKVLFVVALILTAHALKPFSIRSIAKQVLGSVRSFSFILPGETVSGIKQVSYLAKALHTNTIAEPATPAWTESAIAKSRLMASEKQPKLAASRCDKALRARRSSAARQPEVVATQSAIAAPEGITIRLFLSTKPQTVERSSKAIPQRLALISPLSALISSQWPQSYPLTQLRKGNVKRDDLDHALSWLACKSKGQRAKG
jgi:hypothetical protein